MFETLSKQELNAMTSDQYKQNFEGPSGDAFRKRVSELENQPAATRPHGSVRGPEPAPTPATTFDPSFDDDPNSGPSSAPAPAGAAEVPAQPAAAAPAKLAEWRYQPLDSQGRKLGGEQVFRYDPNLPVDDPKSLASQLTKSNMHAVRMAKERKVAEVIDSVKQVATAFKAPTHLTIFEHPEADKLNEMADNALANAALSALNFFKQSHPEFPRGEDNAAAMVRWVEKSGLNPGDGQTWEKAWMALRPYIAPELSAPVVEAVAEVAPAPAPVAAIPAPKRRVGGIPTGLSNIDNTSTDEPFVAPVVQGVKLVIDGKATMMDLRSWNRLPSDAQKRILRNATNASAIDALYRADDDRKAAARSGR